eukprot:CAMPEP_0114261752 /NCGR_PEP_ID=MMETSP0058-20121206/21340_1 /TAXON_ID=36894 /ORGANISM="Pyramimonas parkeae, CCMP726" /LENGTH=268 /DNA_ID=CAMNT_0001377379 /DNA_START=314 /DNA_END=1120 /DNA_ORIENTATION=+
MHVQNLQRVVTKLRSRVIQVKHFLKYPQRLSDDAAALRNAYWCVICECRVQEQTGDWASASTLEHLASEDHLNQARVFWKEHGVNPKVLDVDAVVVSGPELYRWKHTLNQQQAATTGAQESAQALNEPSDQNFQKYAASECPSSRPGTSASVQEELACASANPQSQPSIPDNPLRNAHDHQGPTQCSQLKLESVTRDRKKMRRLPPQRLGAAWSDAKRAGLETEPAAPDWLPAFGRVWESGSRRAGKRKFEGSVRGDIKHKAHRNSKA